MASSIKRLLITFGVACSISALGTTLFLWFQRRRQRSLSVSEGSATSIGSTWTSLPPSPCTKSASEVESTTDTASVFENAPSSPCVVKPFDCGKSIAECLQGPKKQKKKKRSKDSEDSSPSNKKDKVVPTNVLSCDCRNMKNSEELPSDDAATFDSDTDFDADILIPEIHPILYEKYIPLDLTQLSAEDKNQGLYRKAIRAPKKHITTNILTPFRPTLNAIAYGNKHAQLIKELVENYNYLD